MLFKSPTGRSALAASALALIIAAQGGEGVSAMSLDEAMATAYETNPDLATARSRLLATDEGVAAARAGLRPNLQASTAYGFEANSATGPRAVSDDTDPFSAGVQASQPLYDGGRTVNRVRARIADVSAARARLTDLEQQVLLQVVTAYVDILRDEENVSLARNNVRVIAEQLRASQDRFEVGEVTRTDVSQARARLAEAEANLSLAEGRLEVSRQRFRQVVGVAPQNLSLPDRLPPLPGSLDEALSMALDRHPALVAARFDDRAASSDVRAAIGELLPRVSLDGDVGFTDGGVFNDGQTVNRSASVLLRATVPLYQGGAAYSGVRRAQALASAARTSISTEARARQLDVESAWTELAVAQANIRSQRQRVAAAQLAFEGVQEEALVGSRTTLDVLDAEQELLDARVRLVTAIREQYVSTYALLAAIGSLTIADLGIDAAMYDPAISFERNNDRWFGFEATEDTVWEEVWRP
jgi:outer membrane protein